MWEFSLFLASDEEGQIIEKRKSKSIFSRLDDIVFPNGKRIKSQFQSHEKKSGSRKEFTTGKYDNDVGKAKTETTHGRKSVFARLEGAKSFKKSGNKSVFQRLGP